MGDRRGHRLAPHDPAFFEGWRTADGRPAEPLTVWEYLNFSSTMHQAAAFSTLFWQELVAHDRQVFPRERVDAAHYAALRAGGLSAREAQALMNHVHIDDLFSYGDDGADLETATHLAEVLRQAWDGEGSAGLSRLRRHRRGRPRPERPPGDHRRSVADGGQPAKPGRSAVLGP